MIKSMTGYGKAEISIANGRLIVEIRSVNHRYGEISVKLPRGLAPFENDVRKCVAARLKRGKIDVFVQQEGSVSRDTIPALNVPVARAYHEVFSLLKDELGISEPISLALLASQKDVVVLGGGARRNRSQWKFPSCPRSVLL